MINEKVWIINKKFLVILLSALLIIVASLIFFGMLNTVDKNKSIPLYLKKDDNIIICTN